MHSTQDFYECDMMAGFGIFNSYVMPLFKRFPLAGYIAITALMISSVLFLVGVFAPMLTFTRLVVFSNEISLISALIELILQKEILLFMFILLFCIVFPIIKHILLLLLWLGTSNHESENKLRMNLILKFGKWSMLDVFVAAVLLVSVKLSAIASVEVHYAVYAFGASVLITLVMTEWTLHMARLVEQDSV